MVLALSLFCQPLTLLMDDVSRVSRLSFMKLCKNSRLASKQYYYVTAV